MAWNFADVGETVAETLPDAPAARTGAAPARCRSAGGTAPARTRAAAETARAGRRRPRLAQPAAPAGRHHPGADHPRGRDLALRRDLARRPLPRRSILPVLYLFACVSSLTDELRLSLDYYGAQEGATPVEKICATVSSLSL